jgi:O-antigen/teichoic acid export membrane protein
MILTMLVSLYTSRVILNTLGVEDYGIYNVVGGVVSMFAFFNSAMSSATQRFLSYEIGKGDFVQLRKTFNATQIIHIGIAVLIFILAETIGLWFVKTYLVIPAERLEAAIWVYHFSVLSFMVSIIQVPYNATIIAHERMNVYAYVSIIEVTLKLLIVFMLTWITFDKLKLYGILYFCVVFIIAVIYRVYTRRNFQESRFEVVKDKKLYKTLISYSGWNLFGALAGIAQGQGVNILLNIYFGPVANASRAIASQIQGGVHSFVSNFQMAVNPQIIKSFAKDEKEYMFSLIMRSAKLSFYLILLISLPILLELNQILEIWLKNVPKYTASFTTLTIILVSFWPLSNPLMMAIQATGKIRTYQLITGLLMILIFPITYFIYEMGYSAETTYFIAIIIEIAALLIRLHLVKKLLNFPALSFVKEIILKNVIIVCLSLTLPLFIRNLMDENLSRLFIVVFVSIIWNAIIIYCIGLNKPERAIIFKVINKIMKRK